MKEENEKEDVCEGKKGSHGKGKEAKSKEGREGKSKEGREGKSKEGREQEERLEGDDAYFLESVARVLEVRGEENVSFHKQPPGKSVKEIAAKQGIAVEYATIHSTFPP